MEEDIAVVRHPGYYLKNLLDERGLLQADLAFIIGANQSAINQVVNQNRPVNAEMSKALGAAFGLPANHFADLQTAYDLAQADEPDPIVRMRADIVQKYPVRDMVRRGWLKTGKPELLQK